jgi:hypothetical protein
MPWWRVRTIHAHRCENVAIHAKLKFPRGYPRVQNYLTQKATTKMALETHIDSKSYMREDVRLQRTSFEIVQI